MLTKEQKLQGKFRNEDSHKRLMEENGVVSIWLGNANTVEDINDYLEEDYSDLESDFEGFGEDEDPYDFSFVTNLFGLDFGIGSYDHDFSSCEFFEPTNDLELIISPWNDLIPSLKQHAIKQFGRTLNQKYNTVLLLISYRYVPDINYPRPEYAERKVMLEFLGAFPFDEEISLKHLY